MSKLGNLVDVTKLRVDSWYNALTGLGSNIRDKQTYTRFVKGVALTDVELDNLYHENDLAAIIVEALPEEALRKGFYISSGEGDAELAAKVDAYSTKLEFATHLESAGVWARLFGGAAVYLGIDDGQDEDQPVNMDNIKEITFAYVIDRRFLQPDSVYNDPEKDLKFGQTQTYRISSTPNSDPKGQITSLTGTIIHETRVLRLEGARTSATRRERNRGWPESVLQKVDETLTQFGSSWQGVSHLMIDAAQGVFKVKGLMDMLAGGDKETLQSRMELVELNRSVARAIMVDAEMEDFKREAYTFGGIPDILKAFVVRLAGAARMPVMVLFGQSPTGLNATGDGEIRLWYDRVQAYQRQALAPAITRFWELMFAAQDFEGEAPPEWTVVFERLWQMTDQEQAELEKTVAEKDKIYIDAGVLLPEEVALSRHTARGFSMDTQIDMDAREEMLKAEIELAKDKAGEDPIEKMAAETVASVPPAAPPVEE
jgi:phage-related protein (TIGR01555 family)